MNNNIIFSNYEKYIIEYLSHDENQRIVCRREKKKSVYYHFVPMGFDIETYTQYEKDDRGKVISHFTQMYIWQFQFGNYTFIGRTWDEFSNLCDLILKHVCRDNMRTIIFIHNQSFEFSFFGAELVSRGHDIEVFARAKRKPMKITLNEQIFFYDSYLITGYSLKDLAKNYTITQKLDGDLLGYDVPRHYRTELSAEQLSYCVNDVVVLGEFAEYYYREYLCKKQLPMTKTMIANEVVKDKIRELGVSQDVFFLMMKAYPKTKEIYDYQMSFFTGAYTHGMLKNLFDVWHNFLAYDVCSEYPFVMMSKYFPVSGFRTLDISNMTKEKIKTFISNYCCLIECKLKNIHTRTGVTIISKNKIFGHSGNCVWDNGRLYSCDNGYVEVRITEVDIQTLQMHYTFEIEYINIQYAKRGFLPDYMRLSIAELYNEKAELKKKLKENPNDLSLITNYSVVKSKLNSIYGACATKLTFQNFSFSDHWEDPTERVIDFDTIWKGKNKLPAWAIWITAHSRNLVLTPCYLITRKNKDDYLYSDTDSLKVADKKYIRNIFETLNLKIRKENEIFIKQLGLAEKYPNTDFAEMGTFDLEQKLTRIKCLGSKRYISEYKNKDGELVIETTVAGLPKKTFLLYCEKHHLDPFDAFTEDGIEISDIESQKLCAYYRDTKTTEFVRDEFGNVEEVTAQSYVSLIPTTFNLDVKDDLQRLRNKIQRLYNLYDKERNS